MDNFEIKESQGKDMNSILAEAAAQVQEDMKPLAIKVETSYNPAGKTFFLKCRAMDNPTIHEEYLRVFYDFLYYLPVDARGMRYHFELTTCNDITLNSPKHKYMMETSMDLIPDTGGVTREGWNRYVSQLVHQKNGQSIPLAEPDMFLDEDAEEQDS